MSRNGAVAARIMELIRDHLNIDVSSVDTDLIEGGLLDSLALVELLFEIEQEFGVDIPVDELEPEHLRTVEALGRTVNSLQAPGEGSTA